MLLPDDLLGVGPNSTQNTSGTIPTYGGIGVPTTQKQVSYSLEGMFGGGGFSLGQTPTLASSVDLTAQPDLDSERF